MQSGQGVCLMRPLHRYQRGFVTCPPAMLGASNAAPPPPSSWFDTVTALAPLAWYRLGEASGDAINSGSVSGADASPVSSPTYGTTGLVTGDTNAAVTLGGGSHFTKTSIPSALNLSRSLTYAAWVNINTTGVFHPIIALVSGGIDFHIGNAQQLVVYSAGSLIATGTATLSSGTKYFVAFTVGAGSSATWTFYVNGVAGGTGTTSTTFSSTNIRLGNDTFNIFRGVLDECLIFGSALTASDLLALYNAGA